MFWYTPIIFNDILLREQLNYKKIKSPIKISYLEIIIQRTHILGFRKSFLFGFNFWFPTKNINFVVVGDRKNTTTIIRTRATILKIMVGMVCQIRFQESYKL